MNKLIIMTVAAALLLGCASYPRYSVLKGSDGGNFLQEDYEVKRHVDPALAESDSAWNNDLRVPGTGTCLIRRMEKDKISYKVDDDCAVWDATDTRPHRSHTWRL